MIDSWNITGGRSGGMDELSLTALYDGGMLGTL
jgi:hypothetical protein